MIILVIPPLERLTTWRFFGLFEYLACRPYFWFRNPFRKMAEGERFELSIPCGMPPFQGGALDHYANPPVVFYLTRSSVHRQALALSFQNPFHTQQ